MKNISFAVIGLVIVVLLVVKLNNKEEANKEDMALISYYQKLDYYEHNEKLAIFDFTDTSVWAGVEFVENTSLPLWRKNLEIVDEIETLEHLPQKYRKEISLYRNYANLRIEECLLLVEMFKQNDFSGEKQKQLLLLNISISKAIDEIERYSEIIRM